MAKDSNPVLILFIGAWFILNTLLFPFARFALDSIINYVVTGNQFNLPKIISLLVKLFYLALCWAYAIVLAPIGIIFYIIIKIRGSDRDYYY
ncbi:MAG: hypothetical protein N4Q32_01920 [Neisseriaceae bacterium]|nr:hypothetical protein [Neisseriaceae bacterium]